MLKTANTTLTSFVFPLLLADDSKSTGGLDDLLVVAVSFSSDKRKMCQCDQVKMMHQ